MSARPPARSTDLLPTDLRLSGPRRGGLARRFSRAAAIVGACGAAGLAGCGATGANLAESDGGAKSWWAKPAALARGASLTPPGLVADSVPASRDDLGNPAALDLAYAKLRSDGQASEAAREEAEAAFARVLEDDPRNVEALIGLASLKETAAGDRPGELDAAEDAYRDAVDAGPADARPLLALAAFQAERGRWGESAATYGLAAERAADTRQRRTARHGMAVATAMTGDIEGSRPHFVASVGEASAHFNIGELHRRSGDRDAALREFRLAAARDAGEHPQLAQVGPLIAALEAAAPAGGATSPAFGAGPTRLAAARPPVDAFPRDPYSRDPFSGDPFSGDPRPSDRVRPASGFGSTPPASPAAYSTSWDAPAPRPASVPAPPFAPAVTEPDAPPPWPYPPAG